MTVTYGAAAKSDLEQIATYYIDRDAAHIATWVLGAVHETLRSRCVPGFSRAARYVPSDDVYELPVPGLPYVVTYRVLDDVLDVIAVTHTARDPRARRPWQPSINAL